LGKTTPVPPSDQRQFLRLVKNHADFKNKLVTLALASDLALFQDHVLRVSQGWFDLSKELLIELIKIDMRNCPRSAYSRSYYAAYNASKAVRYLVYGEVSLGGDDHRRVAELPDSFPDVDSWTPRLTELYEHRLRADYDNWSGSAAENTLTPVQSYSTAKEFVDACRVFVASEYGVSI
jgi:hypothetical protein